MSRLLHVLIFSLCFFSGYGVLSQNYPVYNGYYINPYLYNPAEIISDYAQVFVNHRRQWTGVEGAPVLSTLNFNTTFKNSRTGLGGKISSYKRGILNTTDLSLSAAYGFRVNYRNALFFGLSGGAITNSIDINKVSDPSDPAIAGYLSNNIQPTANFGMLYRSASGLNLGFILPQLFTPSYNATTNFSGTKISALDNFIVVAYYKHISAGKMMIRKKKGIRAKVKEDVVAPIEIYTMYKYNKIGISQFEVLAKLNLSPHFWIGGAYKQSYGFTGITGFTFNKFILSYAYEPGGQPEAGFSSGTHELQLGLRFGKQKKFIKPTPNFRSRIKTENEQHIARFQQTVEDTDQVESPDDKDDKKKYYVVIKVFSDFNGADQYKKKLIDDKYNADIFYNEKDRKYYVHVLETNKASEANDEAKNLKAFTKLKDARVLTVEPPK